MAEYQFVAEYQLFRNPSVCTVTTTPLICKVQARSSPFAWLSPGPYSIFYLTTDAPKPNHSEKQSLLTMLCDWETFAGFLLLFLPLVHSLPGEPGGRHQQYFSFSTLVYYTSIATVKQAFNYNKAAPLPTSTVFVLKRLDGRTHSLEPPF